MSAYKRKITLKMIKKDENKFIINYKTKKFLNHWRIFNKILRSSR